MKKILPLLITIFSFNSTFYAMEEKEEYSDKLVKLFKKPVEELAEEISKQIHTMAQTGSLNIKSFQKLIFKNLIVSLKEAYPEEIFADPIKDFEDIYLNEKNVFENFTKATKDDLIDLIATYKFLQNSMVIFKLYQSIFHVFQDVLILEKYVANQNQAAEKSRKFLEEINIVTIDKAKQNVEALATKKAQLLLQSILNLSPQDTPTNDKKRKSSRNTAQNQSKKITVIRNDIYIPNSNDTQTSNLPIIGAIIDLTQNDFQQNAN